MLHNTFLYILMSFLFLNAADDDVLLLSQISLETQRVCIAPLVQQRGGLSHGPLAQWVPADFYLIDDQTHTLIPKDIQIEWRLGEGGAIRAKSKKDWRSLKIIPTITPEIYRDLILKPGEVLFFELTLYKVGATQRICSDVIMVRQQEDQIYRKKIELPILNNSKGIIHISIL